jgi:putative FmdB family regulatory protein
LPNYEFRCTECKHYFEKFISMSRRQEPTLDPCPNCTKVAVKQVMETPFEIGDAVRLGIRRPDKGFSEVLQKIHHQNPGSKIKDTARYFDG